MSVVNQMLQDLEQRRAAEQPPLPSMLNAAQGKRARRSPVLWLMLLTLAGSGIYLQQSGEYRKLLVLLGLADSSTLAPPQPQVTLKNQPAEALSVAVTPEVAKVAVAAASPVSESLEVATVALPSANPVITVASEEVVAAEREAIAPEAPVPPPTAVVAATAGIEKNRDSYASSPPVAAAPNVNAAVKTVAPAATARVKQLRPPTPAELAERAYQQGVTAFKSGDFSAAEGYWRQALTQLADHHSSRKLLLQLLLQRGRRLEAEALLTPALASYPTDRDYLFLQAKLYLKDNNYSAATPLLQGLLQQDPSQAEVHAALAAIYQQQGALSQSGSHYQQALQLAPHEGRWWISLALLNEQMGDETAAVAALYSALRQADLPPPLQRFAREMVQRLAPDGRE
ncbi:MAG: tetratricopeptide repeat protein [Gammaproteobacteria bacterium]|nr:tetratricopeptide repeat protein [Gammaproteobacteria bacterium]